MFSRRDKLSIKLGIALIFISFLLFLPSIVKFFLSKQPPVGESNLSTFQVLYVNPRQSVTIALNNLPPDTEITVKMGEFGTQGVGGVLVDKFNSGNDINPEKIYDIPDQLKDAPKIAIRVEAGFNRFAYKWFDNHPLSYVPPTGEVPNPLGFVPLVNVYYPQSYEAGQSKIVRLTLSINPNVGASGTTVNVQDICFQSFIVSPSFDILPLTPSCMSPIVGGAGSSITWEWNIRPKSDSYGKQQLDFGVYEKLPNQNFIEVDSLSKDVDIKPQHLSEQIQQIHIDTWFTPITGIFTALMGIVAVIIPIANKSRKKPGNKQPIIGTRTDYIIQVPYKEKKIIDAIVKAATKTELKEAKSRVNKAVIYSNELLSKNPRLNIQSIGYLYDPNIKDWELSYFKTSKPEQVIKTDNYYEPCHPVPIAYEDGKDKVA